MSRLVIVILLCALLPARSLAAPPDEITGTAHTKDGDDLIIAGTDVRLHGIDAFEHNQTCAKDGNPSWPCGTEATQALDRLVAGHEVRCILAQRSKTQGRPAMRCYVGELELNAEMVRLGYALDCPRFSHRKYQELEDEAEKARRGAWQGTFKSPWDFKGQHYCDRQFAPKR